MWLDLIRDLLAPRRRAAAVNFTVAVAAAFLLGCGTRDVTLRPAVTAELGRQIGLALVSQQQDFTAGRDVQNYDPWTLRLQALAPWLVLGLGILLSYPVGKGLWLLSGKVTAAAVRGRRNGVDDE